jgi:hypothetical protein
MFEKVFFTIRNWDFPRGLLVTSAFFTIAATACLVTIWFQLRAFVVQQPESPSQQISMADKERVLASVSGTSTSLKPAPGQTDLGDDRAPAKLKLLQSFNAHN